MKKYQKPVLVKKEQNRVHGSVCGWSSEGGGCGKQVLKSS